MTLKYKWQREEDFIKATISVIKTQNAYVWNTFTKAEELKELKTQQGGKTQQDVEN